MRVFTARNTNHMGAIVYHHIEADTNREDSRNGKVLAFDTPCAFVYTHPQEMVNLCPVRDANPFFHLMEAVAMVAEANSVELLCWFNSQMRQYSDNGVTYNAFYGTRMGNQFNQAVSLLHKDPDTRQAVIQLWDKKDLLKDTKDKACNMSMVFRRFGDIIDMTVFCRSNDLIYGGVTGANVVHFPFIHAVLCYELECIQGSFVHVVNNAHVYVDNPKYECLSNYSYTDVSDMIEVGIDCDRVAIKYFCNIIRQYPDEIEQVVGGGKFMNGVLVPMYNAFARHKSEKNGLSICHHIYDDAWRKAASQWLMRREQ